MTCQFSDLNDLARWASEALGPQGDDITAMHLARYLRDEARTAGLRWGQDWQSVIPEGQAWLDLLDRVYGDTVIEAARMEAEAARHEEEEVEAEEEAEEARRRLEEAEARAAEVEEAVTAWHVPPACQGQMVEVAYGVDPEWGYYRRTTDRSRATPEPAYEVCTFDAARDYVEWEPWNTEPAIPSAAWEDV